MQQPHLRFRLADLGWAYLSSIVGRVEAPLGGTHIQYRVYCVTLAASSQSAASHHICARHPGVASCCTADGIDVDPALTDNCEGPCDAQLQ